jgi:hypothetical protein
MIISKEDTKRAKRVWAHSLGYNSHCKEINDWLKEHPNPDLYFDAIGLNEADRVLYFLKN